MFILFLELFRTILSYRLQQLRFIFVSLLYFEKFYVEKSAISKTREILCRFFSPCIECFRTFDKNYHGLYKIELDVSNYLDTYSIFFTKVNLKCYIKHISKNVMYLIF